MFFESFISFIISFLFGASTLVIGARNPIHSILILILVFFLGSILLFLLSMEYFAILFLIVYVGAIVVLFLFIVMMLEIKMVNSSERFSDLFSFKNIILGFLVLEILFFSNEEFWDITPVFEKNIKFNWNLTEVNLYTDYSKALNYIGQLKAIGGILFSQYFIAIILISVLLFVSMFGSIVMTLESTKRIIIKQQDATLQGFRTPVDKLFSKNLVLSVAVVDGASEKTWGTYLYNGTMQATTLVVENPITTVACVAGVLVVGYVSVVYVGPFVWKLCVGTSIAKVASELSKEDTIAALSKKVAEEQVSRLAAEAATKTATEKLAQVTAELATTQVGKTVAEAAAKTVVEKLAEVTAELATAQTGKAAAESAKIVAETQTMEVIAGAIRAVTNMGAAVERAVSGPVRDGIEAKVIGEVLSKGAAHLATRQPALSEAIVHNELLKMTSAAKPAAIWSMNYLSESVIEAVNTIGLAFNEWIQQFGS